MSSQVWLENHHVYHPAENQEIMICLNDIKTSTNSFSKIRTQDRSQETSSLNICGKFYIFGGGIQICLSAKSQLGKTNRAI